MIMPCYFINESFIDMTDNALASMGTEIPDQTIIVDDGSPCHAEFADVDYTQR